MVFFSWVGIVKQINNMNNEEHEILTNDYNALIRSMAILFYKDILAPLMLFGRKRVTIGRINASVFNKSVELSEFTYGLPYSSDLYMTMMCKIGHNIITISFYSGNININMYVYDENNVHRYLSTYTTKSVRLIKRRKVFSTTDRHLHSSDVNPNKYIEDLEEYIIPLLKGISEIIKSEIIRLQNNEER